MALNDAGLDLAGEGIAAGITHASLHTADPGVNGTANVIAGGRFAVDLISTNGDVSLNAPVDATGLTPLDEVAFLGLWSADSAGTYYGSVARTAGDEAVNAAGEYSIEALDIPGSST